LKKTPAKMIVLVMEPLMIRPQDWKGSFGLTLGNNIFVDMSNDDIENNIAHLIKVIKEKREDEGGGDYSMNKIDI
jgi:hypothetical protein